MAGRAHRSSLARPRARRMASAPGRERQPGRRHCGGALRAGRRLALLLRFRAPHRCPERVQVRTRGRHGKSALAEHGDRVVGLRGRCRGTINRSSCGMDGGPVCQPGDRMGAERDSKSLHPVLRRTSPCLRSVFRRRTAAGDRDRLATPVPPRLRRRSGALGARRHGPVAPESRSRRRRPSEADGDPCGRDVLTRRRVRIFLTLPRRRGALPPERKSRPAGEPMHNFGTADPTESLHPEWSPVRCRDPIRRPLTFCRSGRETIHKGEFRAERHGDPERVVCRDRAPHQRHLRRARRSPAADAAAQR